MVAAALEDQRLWYDLRDSAWYVNCLLSRLSSIEFWVWLRNSGGSEQSLLNVVLQQHVSCRGCGRMSSRRVDKKKWRVSRRFCKSTWLVILISTHIYTQCRDMQGLVLRTHCRSALCVLIQRLPKTRDLGTPIQLFPTLLSDFQVVHFFLQNRAKMCQDLLGFARDQHAQEGLH